MNNILKNCCHIGHPTPRCFDIFMLVFCPYDCVKDSLCYTSSLEVLHADCATDTGPAIDAVPSGLGDAKATETNIVWSEAKKAFQCRNCRKPPRPREEVIKQDRRDIKRPWVIGVAGCLTMFNCLKTIVSKGENAVDITKSQQNADIPFAEGCFCQLYLRNAICLPLFISYPSCTVA